MLLDGQVAVITGSAMGIGRGIAIALAEEGADMAGLDIAGYENAQTAATIRALGRRALAVDCDIADKVQVRRAFNEVMQAYGRVDILINNAAIYADTSLTLGTFESQSNGYEKSVDICAMGSYYCALAAVPSMRENGGGQIVNIITEHIKEGHMYTGRGASGYDAAKWVQWRQTESWAVELKEYGIRVNALCPGATDTPMLRAVSVPAAERGMKPADLGRAVLNIIRQGDDGPVGQSWLIGPSGSTSGPDDIEKLLTGEAYAGR